MEYRRLGRTDLKVSVIGLGTMTFGEQNTEKEAHAQLDCAVDHGVNLIDAAELYPVPPRAETQGTTERFIGNWLKRSGKRDKVILATKVSGPARTLKIGHLRDGITRLDRANLQAAVDASLERLQTDCIDLYQLHWPDRPANYFGRLGYEHAEDPATVPIEETLAALGELRRAGKIRHIGVSNETAWGVSRFLRAAETGGLDRIVSIQNPYNLLNRSFEVGLAEFAIREQVGLVAYSPLGFGVLTGKFLNGARPPEARIVRWARFARYTGEVAERATAAYVGLAKDYGLHPAQMALAFVQARRFVTSTLVGATTLEQLRCNLASSEIRLDPKVVEEIDRIHRVYSNPCP